MGNWSEGRYQESYGATDWLMAQAAECDPRSPINMPYRRKVTNLWEMRDGNKLRICDMDSTHLINAIRMVERAHFHRCLTVPLPTCNGEMAQDAADQWWDDEVSRPIEEVFPIYEHLVAEAQRRKLKWVHGTQPMPKRVGGAPSMEEFLAAQAFRRERRMKRARAAARRVHRGPARGKRKKKR